MYEAHMHLCVNFPLNDENLSRVHMVRRLFDERRVAHVYIVDYLCSPSRTVSKNTRVLVQYSEQAGALFFCQMPSPPSKAALATPFSCHALTEDVDKVLVTATSSSPSPSS